MPKRGWKRLLADEPPDVAGTYSPRSSFLVCRLSLRERTRFRGAKGDYMDVAGTYSPRRRAL